MEKQAKALDDSPKHCQKSMGFGIREAGSHCFCNPAARPLSLKFSHVEKGYNTHLTVVLWQGCEGNHVSKGTVLTKQFIPKSVEPEQDTALLPG